MEDPRYCAQMCGIDTVPKCGTISSIRAGPAKEDVQNEYSSSHVLNARIE